MNNSMLILALLGALGLSACDRPTVVNVPTTPVAVPGPADPAGPSGTTGATGAQGSEGSQGAAGKTGEGTTVIVTPPASAPAN